MTLEIKTRWNSVPLVSNHVDQIKSKHIDLHTESGHVAEQVIENFFCRIASAKLILYLKPKNDIPNISTEGAFQRCS